MQKKFFPSSIPGMLCMVIATTLLFLSTGCGEKEIISEDWQPKAAVPLMHRAKITGEDILSSINDGGVHTLPGGTLEKRDTFLVLNQAAQDVIQLQDQSLNNVQIAIDQTTIDLVEQNFVATQNMSGLKVMFQPTQQEELHSVRLKGGSLRIGHGSSVLYDGIVKVSSAHIHRNNNPLDARIAISNGSTASEVFDLSGYEIQLDQTNMGANELELDVEITYTDVNGIADTSQKVILNIAFENLQFSEIRCNLNGFNFQTGLFSNTFTTNIKNATVFYTDPRVKAVFENSFGTPWTASFNVLQLQTNTGLEAIQSSVFGEGSILTIGQASAGNTNSQSFLLEQTNSNIQDLVNNQPSTALCEAEMTAGIGNHAILDTSSIQLKLLTFLPFEGWARGFSNLDTASFEIPEVTTIENVTGPVEEIEIKITLDNSFPIEGSAQIYLLNDNEQVADSLFKGGDYQLAAQTLNDPVTITISKHDLETWRSDQVMKFVTATTVQSLDANNQNIVQIQADQTLTVDVGVVFKIKI